MTYPIPSGPLLKLLLIHIRGGHQLLTQDDRGNPSDRMVRLFVGRSGREFSNSTFTQYWEKFMEGTETNGQAYFAPSVARTMFIEQVGAMHNDVLACLVLHLHCLIYCCPYIINEAELYHCVHNIIYLGLPIVGDLSHRYSP